MGGKVSACENTFSFKDMARQSACIGLMICLCVVRFAFTTTIVACVYNCNRNCGSPENCCSLEPQCSNITIGECYNQTNPPYDPCFGYVELPHGTSQQYLSTSLNEVSVFSYGNTDCTGGFEESRSYECGAPCSSQTDFVTMSCDMCSYEDPKTGLTWNLNDLTYNPKDVPPPGYSYQVNSNEQFFINFCQPVNNLAIGDGSGACSNAGSCQKSYSSYYNAGQADEFRMSPIYQNSTAYPVGINLQYQQGSSCSIGPRVSNVEVLCDPEGNDEITSVEELSSCTYLIRFRSPKGCPVYPEGNSQFAVPFTTQGIKLSTKTSYTFVGNLTINYSKGKAQIEGIANGITEYDIVIDNAITWFSENGWCTEISTFLTMIPPDQWKFQQSLNYTTSVYHPGTVVPVDEYKTHHTYNGGIVYVESGSHNPVWASSNGLFVSPNDQYRPEWTEFDYTALHTSFSPLSPPSEC